MNKKEFFKQRIDKIAKESFNAEQKEIAKKIIDNANEEDIDAVWSLINQRVKTGFVFDEAPEINHNCVAYLKENSKLGINLDNKDALEHSLIIGENYDALKNLLVTYTDKQGKGIIDVIYIDPPYNTDKSKEEGNDYKDDIESKNKFIYRDKYTRDGWLNMMNERLKLAKKLLSDNGVIFISIDDSEQAYLTVLCNEIFGEENFISNCFVLDNMKGKTNDNFISNVGSRLLIYAKNKQISNINGFNEVENIYGDKVEDSYTLQDENGCYKLITFKKTGQSKFRQDRPLMFYPILEKNKKLFAIKQEEFDKIYINNKFDDVYLNSLKNKYSDYNFILPIDNDGKYLRWTSGYKNFLKNINTNVIYDNGVKQKNRPSAIEMLQEYVSGTPKNFMYKPSYANGTDDLNKLIKYNNFDYPKPISLIKDIIKLIYTKDKNTIVLDFFAGSGTTGQAVMELNEEDGGKRKFILVTNNENNIATDVTRERLYRVIMGKGSKGEHFEWTYSKDKKFLNNNSVRVFDIVKQQLNITEIDKAEKIRKEAEIGFEKLNRQYLQNNNLNIYSTLAALTPYKEEN